MQTKFTIKEVFNNGDLRICQDAYKGIEAGKRGVRDPHNKQDIAWICTNKKCKHPFNQRSYASCKDYIMWVDECSSCHERYLVKKTNKVLNP